MKAAYIKEPGEANQIQYGDLPDPKPGAGQVLVQMKAVAVNPVDTYIRAGANYWDLPQPFIVGCDLAGVVAEVGDQVNRFKPGDRVWCTNQGLMGRQGTFAEYSVVDECWLYPSPENVNDETLAACALVGVTAHLGLFRDARLRPGECVFVNGGSGGVGSMVLQMAKIASARVLATAGSEEKAARCREMGADAVVRYKSDEIGDAVKRFSQQGVDIYWETRREPDFDAIVSYLADRGRIVLMAGRDARPEFPVGPFYVKGLSLHGFVMFKATSSELESAAHDINVWLGEGKLQANIARTMGLSEAAEAHQLQEDNTLGNQGTLIGKIVLVP